MGSASKDVDLYDQITLGYLQTVTSLIEGRKVEMEEILALLAKIVRQHSIGKGKRFAYTFKSPRGEVP
jgi:hypothetical protein